MRPRTLLAATIALAICAPVLAQQTVFNVPSGDVLEHGKVYGELDFGYPPDTSNAALTPRVVFGAGHRVEVGLNLNGLVTGATSQATLTPTLKWKAYARNTWAFLVGDDIFLPVQNRAYDAGNYVYAEGVKSWKNGTRITFGAYHFTAHVVARGQRAGGQFAFEQPVGKRFIIATDWYTGHQALGYLTPGVVVKVTPKFTFYGAYQIGNADVTAGNHQLLLEFGWNFN